MSTRIAFALNFLLAATAAVSPALAQQYVISTYAGGAPRVIATGGFAPLIATGSELIELVDDTLTLEGLRLVFERSK